MDKMVIKEGFLGQRVVIIPKKTRSELIGNVLTSPFYITDIGYYPNALHHMRERKKGAKEYIFIYCTAGEGWVIEKGKKTILGPNQFIIIEQFSPHRYAASKKEPWTIFWMHFCGNLSDALYQRYSELSDSERNIPYSSERMQLFNKVLEVLNDNYRAKDLEYACLLSLHFITNFVFNRLDMDSSTFLKNDLVNEIIEYLNQNMDKALKSEDLAKVFHFSKSHILSTFKKSTGFPLFQYFNMKKVQKACEYLSYTDLSIKEISYKLGFQDQLYFSRLFKNQMGVPPRKYRKDQNE